MAKSHGSYAVPAAAAGSGTRASLVCAVPGRTIHSLFPGGLPLRALLIRPERGNEPAGEPALPPVLHVEVADDGEHHRADEVDEKILHGVQNADIQIAAQPQGVLRAVGGVDKLIDWSRRDPDIDLLRYMDDARAKEDKLFERPELMRTPVVRNGRKATVGYCPDVWKQWEESEK